MERQTEKTDMRVGDLVLPEGEEEFLFTESERMDPEMDSVELTWREVPGVILELSDFSPKRNYKKAKIIVGDVIGWTYSDFIQVVV